MDAHTTSSTTSYLTVGIGIGQCQNQGDSSGEQNSFAPRMPGITNPPVLKSFNLRGKAGNLLFSMAKKESEQAKEKGCNCELQNHEGKHKQRSKMKALAKIIIKKPPQSESILQGFAEC